MNMRISPFLILAFLALSAGCQVIPSPTAMPVTSMPSQPTHTTTTPAQSPTPAPASPEPAPTATLTSLPQGETIVVTSAEDSGPGTLRQALLDAQSGDTITFDPAVFPPDAPVTIFTASELPHIRQGDLTIDASNAGVILDGSKAINPTGEWLTGLQIVDSDANIIRGMQITNFSGPGIAIAGSAKHNVIGGDRSIGAGPFGQGNMLTLNDIGIHLKTKVTSFNTVMGNLIGTDAEGAEGQGNNEGILIETAARNTIGPNNIIAHNIRLGITLSLDATENTIGPDNIIAHNGEGSIWAVYPEIVNNTFTGNIIHDNYREDIIKVITLAAPVIFDYDLRAGILGGAACPNCTVDIFSGEGSEGAIFEGKTTADGTGVFAFDKGSSFNGPHLTATATDLDGNTSQFSRPTSGSAGSLDLQRGNDLPRLILQPMQSRELVNNRLSTQIEAGEDTYTINMYDGLLAPLTSLGVKHMRLSFNDMEVPFDPAPTEFFISQIADAWTDSIISNGITITYVLTFWDKEFQIGGGEVGCPRFKKEDEIQRYLDYVQFIVHHFKDRIQYFEIWNEPNNTACPQWIEVNDYIQLVRRTVPVIRQEYPQAKIVVGGTTGLHSLGSQEYLFGILQSDIMPLVDVVAWHPFYGASPQYPDVANYYNSYPSLLQKIRDVASTAGFTGEYRADELTWRTPLNADSSQPWTYPEAIAAKYYARGMVMHLGMDVAVGVMVDDRLTIESSTVRNLATVMAGVIPIEFPVEVQGAPSNLRVYTFASSSGGELVALWTDGIARDDALAIEVTLVIPDREGYEVVAMDILRGYQQQLISHVEDGNLIIPGLLVEDYPILLRIER